MPHGELCGRGPSGFSKHTESLLRECTMCPWECGADRLDVPLGRCGAAMGVEVARAALHQWEEPCLSGTSGSGTVFLAHCNLSCCFCQNHAISQAPGTWPVQTAAELADTFVRLEATGAHNVNLVSGSHYVPQLAEAIGLARGLGLGVPVVWNSGGYDSVRALELLDGLVDVYLPDLKYSDDALACELSGAPGYWGAARRALREMLRQVGPTRFDDHGLAVGGLVVRHLVLPGHIDNTKDVLDWVRVCLPRGVHVSLMGQYFPAHAAVGHAELGRSLTESEYAEALEYLGTIGIENGWVQELDSASADYVPPFPGPEGAGRSSGARAKNIGYL